PYRQGNARSKLALPAPAGRVVRRGQGGDRLGAGAGVALQGAQGGVAGLGHEQRQGDVVLGQVCDGGVPELVQSPAGGGMEDLLGPAVGQARIWGTARTSSISCAMTAVAFPPSGPSPPTA